MIVPGLPSFGDIVDAIALLKTSYKALKDSGESVAKYDESISFLQLFETCNQHISSYAQNNPGDAFSTDIKRQLQTLDEPGKRLSKFLAPYKAFLDNSSTPSPIAKARAKIKYAIKESQSEVLALKTATAPPLLTIIAMLSLQNLESSKQTDLAAQCAQITDAVSKTPVLLQLKASLNAIEASQRDQQSAETAQARITLELKQAIADVDTKLNQELQLRPTQDYTNNQALVRRFDTLHTAVNRLESIIRQSPLEKSLTEQHERAQVAQFALEMKLHEIRERLDEINADRLRNQSIFQSTLNAITHVATGIGAAVFVGRQMRAAGPASTVEAAPEPKSSKPDLEYVHTATPSETPRPNLKCDHQDCGKTFNSVNELNHHQRNYIRPFTCDIPECGIGFAWQKDLDRHQLMHNVRSYKCDFPGCNEVFIRREKFDLHRLKHNRDKARVERRNLKEIQRTREEYRKQGEREGLKRKQNGVDIKPEKSQQQVNSQPSDKRVPGDIWICCECKVYNCFPTAPDVCPVCGHLCCGVCHLV